MRAIRNILVPVDYSAPSFAALEAAMSVARSMGAKIDVLHTWSNSAYADASIAEDTNRFLAEKAEDEMKDFLSKFEPPLGVEMNSRVQLGVPWQVITALSKRYDLIVMGTHGRTGLSRLLLGSVAAHVVPHAECPVMTVRAGS